LDETPRGRYFEELSVGDTLVTNRRTITEADIVNFAGLSGDFNPLHTDEVYGQSTPFGGRIAHGMLVVSIGTGLVNQTGWFAGTTLALLEITRKFVGVVKPGDTVHLAMEVATAKASSRGNRGVITFNIRIINQRDETVIEGQEVVMLRRRPQAGEA
jgi:acyl dehydratase